MAKFLYGAAVQGIQNFIFQTGKLQEIVGASELVEQICTIKFAELLYPEIAVEKYFKKRCDALKQALNADENAIINAAGNIKYVFTDKTKCEEVVRIFPKIISKFAPGITLSQAVIKLEDNEDFANKVDELEEALKAQRNRPMRSATLGLMAIERSRQTGLPAVEIVKDEHRDAGTKAKYGVSKEARKELCVKAFGVEIRDREFPYDIEDITDKNSWIAIIHADGNGLGQIVQRVGKNKKKFREFSQNLDKATTNAAQRAFGEVLPQISKCSVLPIRPIVLGGDDLTIICRGDIALPFAKAFLNYFEVETATGLREQIKDAFDSKETGGLTACAGIAYIKASFPFSFGYELAEQLCSAAKKDAKYSEEIKKGERLPQSCLMFHKVQDSFVEEYKQLAERELQPKENISFQFGPYYLEPQTRSDAYNEKVERISIDDLIRNTKKLDSKEGNAVKSHLRQWMTLMHYDPEKAKPRLDRLLSNLKSQNKSLFDVVNGLTKPRKEKRKINGEEKEIDYYPIYDILAIHTINTQTTKKEDKED